MNISNLPQLSARAAKALQVLADGGRFDQQLERNYHGVEQWQYRLKAAGGGLVKGIGLKAFYELHGKGLIISGHSSSVHISYVINKGA